MKIIIVFLFGFINGIAILEVVAQTSTRNGISSMVNVQEAQAVQQNVAMLQQANVTMKTKLDNTTQSLQQVITDLKKIKEAVKIEGVNLTLYSQGKVAIKGSNVSIDGNQVKANGSGVVTCEGGKPSYHQFIDYKISPMLKFVENVKCN